MTQLRADADLIERFAWISRQVDNGTLTVHRTRPDATEVPETIKWKTPHHTTLERHPACAGRGNVVGVVVYTGNGLDVVGYAVDTSDYVYRPDTHRGPILVPIELIAP